jgi:hypothetical protein
MNDILDRARRDIARCLYKYGLLQSQPFKTDGPRKGGLWVLLPLAAQIYHVLPLCPRADRNILPRGTAARDKTVARKFGRTAIVTDVRE